MELVHFNDSSDKGGYHFIDVFLASFMAGLFTGEQMSQARNAWDVLETHADIISDKR